MGITEITENERAAADAQAAPADFTHCAECGAPVDHLQRYCVECGAHRAGVPDPAAEYLSRTTRRARPQAGPAGARPRRRRRRLNGLVVTLALAVPVAGGIGVVIGDASSGGGSGTPAAHSGSAAGKSRATKPSGVDNATGESYLKQSLSGPSQVSVP